MSTARNQQRYEQLVQEELSKIILRELDVEPGILVTITKVTISADFAFARVYVTVFPENITGTVLEKLRKKRKDYQYFLADVVRGGRSPHLEFYIDEQMKEGFKMDEILDEITQELESEEQVGD
jgi:ribosome-binding factor A